MSTIAWHRLGALICFSIALPVLPLLGQVSVKLLPSEGADFDYFGEALALDGDYAIVGSWLDDNASGEDAGSARIFHRVGAEWLEQTILLASDGEAGDQFGVSVSINGNFAFVGAHRDDNANGPFAGAVYIFERSGESWVQREKLLASDGGFDEQFGGAIASYGNRLIVGAPGAQERRGAAYIYHEAGGDWLFVNKVAASDAVEGDGFGQAVDINGDYGVVGTATSDGGGVTDAGAAYALVFNGSSWVEQAKLLSESPTPEGGFGQSVSVSDDYIFVGAPQENFGNLDEAGAVYVFRREGVAWNQQDRITEMNAEAGDAFGFSVVVRDDYAVVGARWDRNNQGNKSGAAYVYTLDGADWESEARLLSGDGDVGDQFGNVVGVSNEQVIVGARWDDNQFGSDVGAAYIFPIGGSGVPSLLTSQTNVEFGNVAVGQNVDAGFEITNIGTADLNVISLSISGADAANFNFVQGGGNVVLAPLASVNTVVEFAPMSPGEKQAILRIESNSPSSPHFVELIGAGTDGFQPGMAKVIASRGNVESFFGSTVSVEGDYAIVGAEGQRETEPGAAYIYKRSGDSWVQEIRITSLDGQPGDRFGSAVDISSTHAIVGAWNDDTARGAAYVFVKSGSAWIQQARLEANDRALNDQFGISVSIEGDFAIVGAWQDSNVRGSAAGAAYVFELVDNVWQQQFKLLASDGAQGDRFGSAVAVQGTDVIVGAANGGFLGEGAAYVFSRNGAIWQEEGTLGSSDAGLSDGFGTTVTIEDDIAVVGAPIHDNQSSIDEGAAYVFERINDEWVERIKLTASDGASGYMFGGSVDISGSEIAIGAGGARNQAGAIYIFARSGDAWFETNVLTAAGGEAGDAFGSALAFTGVDIIAGAPDDNNINGQQAGSVYLFSRQSASWTQQAQLLASSRLVQSSFGAAVAIEGDYAVIGAEGNAGSAGAAYVYRRTEGNWTQQTELFASGDAPGDQFGGSVAISDNYIVIGVPGDDNEKGTDAGAVYVFLRSSETWSEQARLVAADGQSGDEFGFSVAIDGDYIAVGSPGNDNTNGADAGGVYVFVRNGEAWAQQTKVTASDGAANNEYGAGVGIQSQTLVVGAPGEGSIQGGALYVYERDGTAWSQVRKLVSSDPQAGENLGSAVDIDESYVIAGAHSRGSGKGAAYVFQRVAGVWNENEIRRIEPADGVAGDNLGISVSISGTFALVGGNGVDGGRGATYLYERSGDDWLQQTRLRPVDEGNDAFGLAVALDGDNAVIGARNDDNGNGAEAGAAYLISLTGTVTIVATEGEEPGNEVVLYQNYPNPFSERTTIEYQLDVAQQVRLEVYDVLGRRVATLVDMAQPAGSYEVQFDRGRLSSGVYFYQLETGSRRQTRQFILVQ